MDEERENPDWVIKKFKEDIGIIIRFKDLRHTFASILISQNTLVNYIQTQIGHSLIQVVLNRYGHLMPDVHDQAISALNGLFVKQDSA